jgi:hypothetical protein
MYKHNDDVEASTRDFRIKLIELSILTIAAFSLVLLSTNQPKVKYLLASFMGLIVYQVTILALGANKVRQTRVLKKGGLHEDVEITHYSYAIKKYDYVSLIWYGITLAISMLVVI